MRIKSHTFKYTSHIHIQIHLHIYTQHTKILKKHNWPKICTRSYLTLLLSTKLTYCLPVCYRLERDISSINRVLFPSTTECAMRPSNRAHIIHNTPCCYAMQIWDHSHAPNLMRATTIAIQHRVIDARCTRRYRFTLRMQSTHMQHCTSSCTAPYVHATLTIHCTRVRSTRVSSLLRTAHGKSSNHTSALCTGAHALLHISARIIVTKPPWARSLRKRMHTAPPCVPLECARSNSEKALQRSSLVNHISEMHATVPLRQMRVRVCASGPHPSL